MICRINPIYLKQTEHDGDIYFLDEDGNKRPYDRFDMWMNLNGKNGVPDWGCETAVKFDKIRHSSKHSVFAGCPLYIARNGKDGHKFSILTEEGYEIGEFQDNYGMEMQCENDTFMTRDIASYVAQEPAILKHIPVAMFLERPTFGEEILTKYQEVKTKELQSLPVGKDCSSLVKEVKETVEEMNKIFNNIERTRDTKENFADLFQRDKTL